MKCYIQAIPFVICAVTLLSSVVIASEDNSSSNVNKKTINDAYQAINSRIDVFSETQTVADITQIGRDIEGLPVTEARDSIAGKEQRRTKLELWLKALSKLDRMIDPEFDSNDAPQMNVAPPPAAGLFSGVKPSVIKDPKLRQEYEQAIKINNEKAERYRFQKKLRRLDRDWSSKMSAYTKSQYTSEKWDINEIKALIDAHVSDIARKEQMKKELIRDTSQQPTNQPARGVPQIPVTGKTNDLGTAEGEGVSPTNKP